MLISTEHPVLSIEIGLKVLNWTGVNFMALSFVPLWLLWACGAAPPLTPQLLRVFLASKFVPHFHTILYDLKKL